MVVILVAVFFKAVFQFWEVVNHLEETFIVYNCHCAMVPATDRGSPACPMQQSYLSENIPRPYISHEELLLVQRAFDKDLAMPRLQNVHGIGLRALLNYVLIWEVLASLYII
jgi:hypothetical protein